MNKAGQSEEKREIVTQDQQEPQETQGQAEQQTPLEEGTQENQEGPRTTAGKKRKRKAKPVSEEEIMPRPSYWPIALAVALAVLLLGVAIHPIVIGIGLVLVIAAIVGWTKERR